MTKVKMVSKGEEKGDAQMVFQNFEDKMGKVPNWAKVMAHKPAILAPFSKLVSVTMGPGLVEQDNKWKMAYKVSHMNDCQYCIGVTEASLKKFGVSEGDMKYVVEDISQMKEDEKIAIRYAEAVTSDPNNIPDEVWGELRNHYDEAQVVELTAVIGLFNYINRFNDALEVEPEV